jgi:hypothetical protein
MRKACRRSRKIAEVAKARSKARQDADGEA